MKLLATVLALTSCAVWAEDVPIEGTVQSRCSIQTDIPGVYGNPNAYTLTTTPSDGGVIPITRFDVTLADAYYARVSHPDSFSSSPTLNDTVTFTGSTEVSAVGEANMSGYEAAKTTFGNSTQFDLTVAGSTWFKVSSQADYGYDKSLPAGDYSATVLAECIAR
mgnify:CR=1 FL=1